MVPTALVAGLLQYIYQRTAHVPFSDDWVTIIPNIQHIYAGTLSWSDFWNIHGPHRIVLPRMIELTVIMLTHWNHQIQMTINVGFLVAYGALFFFCLRRSAGSTAFALATTPALSVALFTFVAGDAWFFPFNLTNVMTVFGVALAMWAVANRTVTWQALAVMATGAFVASWSSFGGLLAWIVFFPEALRGGWQKALAWTAVATAVVGTYLIGEPSQAQLLQPVAIAQYVLAYLGAGLGSPDLNRSLALGVVGLAVMLVSIATYWALRRDLLPLLVWLELGAFVILIGAETAVGRGADFGLEQALAPRYEVFQTLWWVATGAVVALTLRAWLQRIPRPLSLGAMLAPGWVTLPIMLNTLAAVGLLALSIRADGRWQVTYGYESNTLLRQQHCVATAETEPDECLVWFGPSLNGPALIRKEVPFLREHRLSIFAP